MPTIPNNVDWSATAAWIALILAIAGPYITARLNNKHQMEIYCMQLKNQADTEKQKALRDCISGIGLFLAHPNSANMDEFSSSFHAAYAYIPVDSWPILDNFYSSIISKNYDAARNQQATVIHLLSETIKESLQ